MFVCHYWQWPILIKCVMCYYLYVLRLLMRSILALNCLLQIEQERSEGESSVRDALALAFRCARFCSASLILFASCSPGPLLMRPRHFVRSCAICSHGSVGMLKSLREALRVSLYRFFWPPWERFPICSSPQRTFFGKRSSGILVTWPVHLNCASFRTVCTLCIPALFRTSVSGILSCHLIFRSFLRQLVWKWFSLWHAVGKLSKFRMLIIVLAAPPIYILSTLCQVWFHFGPKILPRSRPNAALALAILALTSSVMCTTLDNVLPR